jgi:hypothetical protein
MGVVFIIGQLVSMAVTLPRCDETRFMHNIVYPISLLASVILVRTRCVAFGQGVFLEKMDELTWPCFQHTIKKRGFIQTLLGTDAMEGTEVLLFFNNLNLKLSYNANKKYKIQRIQPQFNAACKVK